VIRWYLERTNSEEEVGIMAVARRQVEELEKEEAEAGLVSENTR
tara:strand:- start:86 stop:217 length:132 start_codon:yes stop_codon:yes gene_type:complete